MSRKSKGINAERELIHMFWGTGTWVAARCAGSGSMVYPSPDIIASNGKNTLAIECKSSKSNYIYLTKKEIEELKKFSEMFNAHPLIGVRFSRKDWSFLNLTNLKETEKNFVVSLDAAEKKGSNFIELLENPLR